MSLLVGKPLSRLLPDSLRGRSWQALRNVLHRDETAASVEARVEELDTLLGSLIQTLRQNISQQGSPGRYTNN